MSRPIVHQLPPDYHEVEHLVFLERRKLLALILVVSILTVLVLWWILVLQLRRSIRGVFEEDWHLWQALERRGTLQGFHDRASLNFLIGIF